MSMKRPIDKSKKSNIKCEHCEWFRICYMPGEGLWDCCTNSHSEHYAKKRRYWNRCKQFEWGKGFDYKEET